MAETQDNTPVAEATIKVKADTTEFVRAIEESLSGLEDRLAETAKKGGESLVHEIGEAVGEIKQRFESASDEAVKAFAGKVGAAFDALADRLTGLAEKAAGIQVESRPGPSGSEREDQGLSGEMRSMEKKVDDVIVYLNSIQRSVNGIVARMGNLG